MAHAESSSGGSSTAIVAIVAIVLLVALGFVLLRGSFGRGGGGSSKPGIKGNVEVNVPKPSAGQ
jgi:hypothetical protein